MAALRARRAASDVGPNPSPNPNPNLEHEDLVVDGEREHTRDRARDHDREQHRDEQQLLPRELEADERRAQGLRGACGERGGAHDGDDRRRQHVAIDAEGELVGRRWGLGAG